MASAAPAHTKCGVTVCIPSGTGFTCGMVIVKSPFWFGLGAGLPTPLNRQLQCLYEEIRTNPRARLLLRGLLQLLGLRAQALLLLSELGRELGAEVLRFEHLADLNLGLLSGHRIGAALDPLDGLFPGLALPQPETGDQLLRLGERAVDHGALVSREL